MRNWWRLLLIIWLMKLPGAISELPLSSALAAMPDCAVECLAAAVSNSPCSITNQTCTCTDKTLSMEATSCMKRACTVKENLLTKNLTMTSCGAPIRDNSAGLKVTVYSLVLAAIVVVFQRVTFKLYRNMALGLDDYSVILTILSTIASLVVNVIGIVPNGVGRDVWTLTPTNIFQFLKFFYALTILYFIQVSLLKHSLLFFYLHVFPARPIRRVLWGTIGFNTAYMLTFLIVGVFSCQPISYLWTRWDGEHQGKCIDINAVAWAHAGISIALDVWVLVVPLSQLRLLKLDWRKKIGVGLMFSVGTFITVVSIVRLRALVKFATDIENLTWDYLETVRWSFIEINVGIFCVCMPSLRLFLAYLFPKILGTSHRSINMSQSNSAGQMDSGKNMFRANATSAKVSSHQKTYSGGILCERVYGVDFTDNDEIQLVQMEDRNC
ncbi:hypothetical protein B0J13DRAFT_565654 [Dactylonectria estremocensis]|uniref:CFEM domain-containing protein n=1 Tax=Dactylonectria estremocensis TaxID=1079267 RepID=A0A9P9DSB0_9HYPO|nr:hypothetical protein B0J13DRAFT_565654 [Dactylonectria estremocensis]